MTEAPDGNAQSLSLGYVADIVRHPGIPDRDLYVFDTATDELVEVVDTLGTLLYGVAADSRGRVFIAQTEARNDANGKAGTEGHGMAELENRAFLNRITRVACAGGCGAPAFFELEPVPPADPPRDEALATPFGIAVSGDDSTLVVTAAASSRVFTVDADTGAVLGRADVGAIPRGVALESTAAGAPARAWVLNALENSVSAVDLSDPSAPAVEATVVLDDPSDPDLKRGASPSTAPRRRAPAPSPARAATPTDTPTSCCGCSTRRSATSAATRSSRASSRTSAACAAARPTTGTAFPATPSAASTPPASRPPSSRTATATSPRAAPGTSSTSRWRRRCAR